MLALSNSDYLTDDDMLGRTILSMGCFVGAAAAWNGSRVGAITVILIQLISPLVAVFGYVELSIADWARSVLYIGLSLFMTVNAFRYVDLAQLEDIDLGGSAIIRWGGTIVNGGFVAFLGLGVAILANGATLSVLKGSEIPPDQLEWLREQNFLLSDEKPLYFYVDGAFSIDDGGSLLTDKYIGAWAKDGDEIWSSWILLGQVCAVEMRKEGNSIEDAIFYVHDPGEQNHTELWLSVEGDMHRRMISRLKAINSRKMTPEIQTFCDQDRAIDWIEIAAMNDISHDIVGPESVTEAQRAWLREKEYLMENEEIISFYSHGIYDIDEGGTLLTDQYFGGWYVDDEGVTGWWTKLGDICAFDRLEEDATDRHAYYRVTAPEDAGIDLYLPATGENIEKLVEDVRSLSAASATEEQHAACVAELSSPDAEATD